jgi:phage portal protein BeeE
MTVNAADAQLIEQLQWSAQQVCTAFHVPPALLDLGGAANITDLEALLVKYHSQCLQSLLVNFETALDEGLELNAPYGTEFDIDDLLWMVTSTKTKAAAEAIGAGAMSPNEARFKYFGLGPVDGGASPYLQQQNFSLSALAQRDANDPFSKPEPAPAATPATPIAEPAPPDDAADEQKFFTTLAKALEGLSYAA